MDLQGVVGRGPRDPRGEQLRHAGFKIAAAALVLLAGGEIGELAGDHHLHCHHADFVGDAGEVVDRPPELHPLAGIREG